MKLICFPYHIFSVKMSLLTPGFAVVLQTMYYALFRERMLLCMVAKIIIPPDCCTLDFYCCFVLSPFFEFFEFEFFEFDVRGLHQNGK